MEAQKDDSIYDTTAASPRLIADEAKCFACKKSNTLRSTDRGNARYCSDKCQKKDWPIHKALCDAFSLQEPRPGTNYSCEILFPGDSVKPRFVWIEHKRDELALLDTWEHLERNFIAHFVINLLHKLGRDVVPNIKNLYPYWSLTNGHPPNKCLAQLVRVTHLGGSTNRYFAHSIFKDI